MSHLERARWVQQVALINKTLNQGADDLEGE